MKARLPQRQTLVPMVVMSIVVASLFATLPDLGAGSSSPSSTTLEAGTSGAGLADSTPDDDDLTVTTAPEPPGDGSPTTSADPHDPTTTSTAPDEPTTPSTAPPDDPTTTSTTDPPDSATTEWCAPETTDGQGTTTTGQSRAEPTLTFLDSGRKAARDLEIARWEDAFNRGVLRDPFVDSDRDRFHVRVLHAAANRDTDRVDKVSVTLRTDSADDAYDDGPVTLDLTETGKSTGRFETRGLLLVSNRVDDEQQTDKGVADNQADDRSFRAALGARVTASYGEREASIEVLPGHHTVELHVTALTDAAGTLLYAGEPFLDNPVDNVFDGAWGGGELYRDVDRNGEYTGSLEKRHFENRVLDDIRFSNEVLAQVGIKLVPGTPLVTYQVADATFDKGEFAVGSGVYGAGRLTPEEQALHDRTAWFTPTRNGVEDVEVFYVKRIRRRDAALELDVKTSYGGFAFPAGAYPGLTNKQLNHSLVLSDMDPLWGLAHEVYHVIAQTPGHDTSGRNLMSGSPQQIPVLDGDQKITDSRRLTAARGLAVKDVYLTGPRR